MVEKLRKANMSGDNGMVTVGTSWGPGYHSKSEDDAYFSVLKRRTKDAALRTVLRSPADLIAVYTRDAADMAKTPNHIEEHFFDWLPQISKAPS